MSSLLYLPNWTVLEEGVVIDDDGAYNITATYDVHPEHCPACGSTSFYRHGSPRKEGKKFYDAPVHGRQTFIFVRRQRYRCRDCPKTWSQALPDMDEDRRMTIRCREYIQRQCLLKPNTHVAEDIGCNEKTVREIGAAQAVVLTTAHKKAVRAPRLLGLDEVGIGPEKTMRFILVDLETSWPIDLLASRADKVVENYLANLAGRKEVEIVTTDMWDPYRKAIRAYLPQAIHIVDKWHVVRAAHDGMETARKQFAAEKGVAEVRKDLKGSRKIFTRRPFQLNAEELLRLDGWLKNTPELKGAYDIKEAFMDIWKLRDPGAADAALTAWENSIPSNLRSLFAPLITHIQWQTKRGEGWRGEILNYFKTKKRYSNAATEARNRVLKMIYRLGAGYNFENLRARAVFGKRPARVKAEKAAAAKAELDLTLRTCASCKAVFPQADEAHHVRAVRLSPKKKAAALKKLAEQAVPLCPDCHRFHTADWFNHDQPPPHKSE